MVDLDHNWWYHPVWGAIYMLVNGIILWLEIKKISDMESEQGVSKIMKILSLLCIIGGVYNGFAIFTTYLPGFCFINDTMTFTAFMLQPMSMGGYQLLRLYYCFANNRIYSNKGYSLCIFYILGMMLILIFIFLTFQAIVADADTLKCGYRKWQYFSDYKDDNFVRGTVFDVVLAISLILLLVWDIVTLCMYAWKVWYIKRHKNDDTQWIRIMRILIRVYILTLFYQYTGWIMLSVFIIIANGEEIDIDAIYPFLLLIISLAINISMCLMQKHNDKQYICFLKILSRTRLYYLCCGHCYKSIIIEQCNEKQKEVEEQVNNNNDTQDTSIWNTSDISVKQEHSVMVVLSMETSSNNQPHLYT